MVVDLARAEQHAADLGRRLEEGAAVLVVRAVPRVVALLPVVDHAVEERACAAQRCDRCLNRFEPARSTSAQYRAAEPVCAQACSHSLSKHR